MPRTFPKLTNLLPARPLRPLWYLGISGSNFHFLLLHKTQCNTLLSFILTFSPFLPSWFPPTFPLLYLSPTLFFPLHDPPMRVGNKHVCVIEGKENEQNLFTFLLPPYQFQSQPRICPLLYPLSWGPNNSLGLVKLDRILFRD